MFINNKSILFGIAIFMLGQVNAIDYNTDCITEESSKISSNLSEDTNILCLLNNNSLSSSNSATSVIKYSTKCRGLPNMYKNYLFFERIITKKLGNLANTKDFIVADSSNNSNSSSKDTNVLNLLNNNSDVIVKCNAEYNISYTYDNCAYWEIIYTKDDKTAPFPNPNTVVINGEKANTPVIIDDNKGESIHNFEPVIINDVPFEIKVDDHNQCKRIFNGYDNHQCRYVVVKLNK